MKVYKYNKRSRNSAMRMTLGGLREKDFTEFNELRKTLPEVASKGKPVDLVYNYLGIRYMTKDEYGMFRLSWLVTNGITGVQKVFYTKDYVGKTGKVLWRSLASDMRKV